MLIQTAPPSLVAATVPAAVVARQLLDEPHETLFRLGTSNATGEK
jgi:hypothetical protein